MEMLTDQATHLWEFYEWCLQRADDRVADWPLMHAFHPTLGLAAAYVLFVTWIGPKLMENRKPFDLRWAMVLYNLGIVAFNLHICKELVTASYSLGYSLKCQPVSYTNDPDELRIASALYCYYISKLIEFLDTIFFVLRKKQRQVTFLHVYHHASMFPIWWIGIKWVAGGQSFFGAMINSGIHVIMYTYYGLAILGPKVQPYLWWKRYLTQLQLIQFVIGMAHAIFSLTVKCDFPEWMHWALIVYGITIFSLFANFYYQAYINKDKNKGKRVSNGVETNGVVQSKKTN